MNEYPAEIQEAIVEGKNPDRVNKVYIQYPKDWKAQYNMLLMDGVTCNSCAHIQKCSTLFEQNPKSKSCQFHPNRFMQKTTNNA